MALVFVKIVPFGIDTAVKVSKVAIGDNCSQI